MRNTTGLLKSLSTALLVLYFAVLIFLCLADFGGISIPRTILGIPSDKVTHFAMFFPFPPIAWFAVITYARNRVNVFRALSWILFTGVAFAFLTEIMQGMTDYRSKDYWDTLADIAGTVAGCIAVIAVRGKLDLLLEKIKTSGDKVA